MSEQNAVVAETGGHRNLQDQQVAVTARFRDDCVLFAHGQSDILRDTALSSNFAFWKNHSAWNSKVRYSLAFSFAERWIVMIEVGLVGFGLAGRGFHAPVIRAVP